MAYGGNSSSTNWERFISTSLLCIVILAIFLLSACSSEPKSAEDQIRNVIAAAKTSAEDKELGELKDLITDDYQDSHGNDKKAISRLLTLYFLRNKSIYLLTRVNSINLAPAESASQANQQANVSILVAMAGTPFPENLLSEDLGGFRADFIHFDIVMINTGGADWQVRQADWRRADIKDFL